MYIEDFNNLLLEEATRILKGNIKYKEIIVTSNADGSTHFTINFDDITLTHLEISLRRRIDISRVDSFKFIQYIRNEIYLALDMVGKDLYLYKISNIR